jgi:hypothetical protein
MVTLAREPSMHLGHLAEAFDVSSEYLRLLRRTAENEGMAALFKSARGGSQPKLSLRQRERLLKQFASGSSAMEVFRNQGTAKTVSYSTIKGMRREWLKKQQEARHMLAPAPAPSTSVAPSLAAIEHRRQETLPGVLLSPDGADAKPAAIVGQAQAEPVHEVTGGVFDESNGEGEPFTDDAGAVTVLSATAVRGGQLVQHAGTWLMLGMLHQLGCYAVIAQLCRRRGASALRVVVDSLVIALTLRQGCVEGIRRIATSTAGILLRATHTPTPSWVRRRLRAFAHKELGWLMGGLMARELMRHGQQNSAPSVFYVDNHLRPYSGKHTIRHGWRMQDKRAVPGNTDYWLHDEDGRPLDRVNVPTHDSLTAWLTPIAQRLRAALGPRERILLAFDRAGAFPVELAELRDLGFEFVTYERRPYATLPVSAFDRQVIIDGEEVALHEKRLANLGRGRGRVRRIALRHADGRQMNLLAISKEPAERLVEIMVGSAEGTGGRWLQENSFKYGAERWGINQLDGRIVEAYPADIIIPNPARRRIDRALRIAREREGRARNELARSTPGTAARQRASRDLEASLQLQAELVSVRPSVPSKAPLRDTELAGELVKHEPRYKMVVDALRVACANAESELAATLAPLLPNHAEAKKTLANLFAAPGRITVHTATVTVVLQPAATATERKAFVKFLNRLNRLNLTLPGDASRRHLRFSVQV